MRGTIWAMSEAPKTRLGFRPIKPIGRLLIAAVIGAFGLTPVLIIPTAALDDSGGIQMIVGAILGVAIYQFLM
jgi:hypothetical protein